MQYFKIGEPNRVKSIVTNILCGARALVGSLCYCQVFCASVYKISMLLSNLQLAMEFIAKIL